MAIELSHNHRRDLPYSLGHNESTCQSWRAHLKLYKIYEFNVEAFRSKLYVSYDVAAAVTAVWPTNCVFGSADVVCIERACYTFRNWINKHDANQSGVRKQKIHMWTHSGHTHAHRSNVKSI